MKVLVTGGAGFIGSHIAQAYRDCGHEVVVLDNFTTGRWENIPEGVRVLQMDIRDSALADVLIAEQFDVVNHHAALMSVETSLREPLEYASANIVGTVNLLHAAARSGVRVFIFASSGGTIYGEQDVHPCEEDHPTRPLTPYGVSKLAGEHYVNSFASIYCMRAVNFRYGNVFGPRQNPKGESNVIAIFIEKLLQHQSPTIFGNGTHTRDYVYISDVVRLNCVALEESIAGSFNVGTGQERSVTEVFNMIARCLGTQRKPIYGPERVEQARVCLSSRRLQELVGWRPEISFEEGIHRTVEWFRTQRGTPRIDETATESALKPSTASEHSHSMGNRL